MVIFMVVAFVAGAVCYRMFFDKLYNKMFKKDSVPPVV